MCHKIRNILQELYKNEEYNARVIRAFIDEEGVLIQVLACIVTTGTSILCAQYIGAKKAEDEQNDLITASILMNVGMGVVLTILMSVFYPMILSFLNLSGLVRDYAGEYLSVINRFFWVQLISSIFFCGT